MRLYQILSVFLLLAAAQAAEESTIETAIVDEGKINVRGKPSLIGEVVTQLEQGERVTVLERITNSIHRPGESTNWAKIKLPPNTPVWVFAPFVKDGVVSVSRLNVRAGRGENYSVLGRINRGDPVKHIRTVEEWMEIEQPTNAYAFVDLSLLQFEGEPPRVRTATPSADVVQSATPPVTAPEARPEPETPPAVVTAEPTPDVTNTTETVAAVPTPTSEQPAATTAPEPPITEPSVATPPVTVEPEPLIAQTEAPPTNSVAAVDTPAPAITPEPLPQVAPALEVRTEPSPKRVVRREGVVRATTSIQAPTWYELVHAETKKRINYLFDENLGLNLKDYRGQRVVVSGEEAIDPRWPNTPILDMQSLDVLPDATR